MKQFKMVIQALNFDLALSQRAYVERRIEQVLELHAAQVARVDVWLSDVDATLESGQKRCLVQVTLDDTSKVVIDSVEEDLHIAVHRAADRAGWKVARCLGRRRNSPLMHPGSAAAAMQSGLRMLHLQSSH